MKLSCICVTFGRVQRLQEAIACFLRQRFDGEREMIVFNSAVEQKLIGDFPNVRIINAAVRPPSLGCCRNLAISASTGTHIVIMDDDDLVCQDFLSTYARYFKEGIKWLWVSPQFHASDFKIQGVSPGSCPLFAFTRKVFDESGGYPSLTVGEDRALIGNITEKFAGLKVTVERPILVYSWGNGEVYHASGQGYDQPNHPSARDRVAADLRRRISAGVEPTGEIRLQPKLDHNPEAMIAEYLGQQKPKSDPKDSVCIVQLGRYGDIANILPIALHIHNTFGKPHMMVSREFADILEGVSYVEPYLVTLTNDAINEAMKLAKGAFKHVIRTQIWGKDFNSPRRTPAYNAESWDQAGFHKKFFSQSWVPLFDLRDPDRERKAFEKLSLGRQVIAVNVTHGHSSPFNGQPLLDLIRQSFPGFQIVDVGSLRLAKVFDMVGIIERSEVVVSIDTALLHLAAGTWTPVVALVNPATWQGSSPRCRVLGKPITYDDANANPAAVIDLIRSGLSKARPSSVNRMTPCKAPIRRIFHAVATHEAKESGERTRKRRAQASWEKLYAAGVVPCPFTEYPRTAKSIGDARDLPFLKDCLHAAMVNAGDDDIIMWTNDDNWLHPALPDFLRFHVSLYGCCTSQRVEFIDRPVPPGPHAVEKYAEWGRSHMGRDLFAFTKRWLMTNWNAIPDFILGASDFDLCMAIMIRLEHGIFSSRSNLDARINPAEIPAGYVCHQYHVPFWQSPANEISAPSQVHNRKLLRDFAAVRIPSLTFDQHNRL